MYCWYNKDMVKYTRKCMSGNHVVPGRYLVSYRRVSVCFDCIRGAKTSKEIIHHIDQLLSTLPESKICPKCLEEKSTEKFGVRNYYSRLILRSYCLECQQRANSDWYQRNKAKRAEYMREYRKRRR